MGRHDAGGGIDKSCESLESADAAAQEVAAEPEDTHRVRFSWTARGAARLAVEVRDVLGTASESLQIEQKLLPDERPEAVLRQPAGDVLATPDSELPLEAASDGTLHRGLEWWPDGYADSWPSIILFPLLGLLLNPIMAAAAMAMSSVSVVTNSLRLRAFRSVRR